MTYQPRPYRPATNLKEYFAEMIPQPDRPYHERTLDVLVSLGLSPETAKEAWMGVKAIRKIVFKGFVFAFAVYFFSSSGFIQFMALYFTYHISVLQACLAEAFALCTVDIPVIPLLMSMEALPENFIFGVSYIGSAICLTTVGFFLGLLWSCVNITTWGLIYLPISTLWRVWCSLALSYWAQPWNVQAALFLLYVSNPEYFSFPIMFDGLPPVLYAVTRVMPFPIRAGIITLLASWRILAYVCEILLPLLGPITSALISFLLKGLLLAMNTVEVLFQYSTRLRKPGTKFARSFVSWAMKAMLFLGHVFTAVQSFGLSKAADFEYAPLSGDREIRLLRLGRQISPTTINAKLIHLSLDDNPQYECISYVGGDSTKTHTIILDGQRFEVSTNVWNILRQRKSRISARYLWIDSICINQLDDEEKTQQVIMMRDIYTNAKRVTVWLGNAPDAADARILIRILTLTLSMLPPEAWGESILRTYMRARAANGDVSPPDWLALRRLFANPWFERCWVIQEMVVASRLFVIYGGHYIEIDSLLLVLAAFTMETSTLTRRFLCQEEENRLASLPVGLFNAPIMQWLRLQYLKKEKSLELYRVLLSSVTYRASNPRDKIFALQGITEAAGNMKELPINYKFSMVKVLLSTAHYFIKIPEALKVLKMAGCGLDANPNTYSRDLPSSVVDWTRVLPIEGTGFNSITDDKWFAAATEREPKIYVLNRWKIGLDGVRLDKIKERGMIVEPPKRDAVNSVSETEAKWLLWFREAEPMAKKNVPNPYFNGQTREEAFWRTCIADHR